MYLSLSSIAFHFISAAAAVAVVYIPKLVYIQYNTIQIQKYKIRACHIHIHP